MKAEFTEQKEIRIVVEDEHTLYVPFSPEADFDESLKTYIRSKTTGEKLRQTFVLTVISGKPVDEKRFRSAVSNWIRDERVQFRKEEKETVFRLVGSLLFGSILVVLSIALQQQISVLKYSLLPIMGSLALSSAARILITDMPTVRAKRWMLDDMEKKNVITFEYNNENKDTSSEGK